MTTQKDGDFQGNYMENFHGDQSPVKIYPGGYHKAEKKDNVVYFYCEETTLAVYVVSDKIIRFRYANHTIFEDDFSYAIDPGHKLSPTTVEFREVEGSHGIVSTPVLDVMVSKDKLSIKILDKEGYTISEDEAGFHWESHPKYGGNIVICTKKILGSENFYGLGDKPAASNLRGKRFQMWGSDTYAFESDTDPIYKNIPFLVGLHHKRAYGIFFDNSFRTFFDLGHERPNVYSFWAQGGEMNYYFIYGPELLEVSRDYHRLTGVPEMPPKWSLGYHQSKWSYYPEKVVKDLAKTFRDKKIPCDVIHIDIDYMDGYRCFTWDKSRFPDPARMISELHDQGFKSVVIIDPGIKIDRDYFVFSQGVERDIFCKRMDGAYLRGSVWPGLCHFPDYTLPEARDWWASLFPDFLSTGIDGVWNDMNEPAMFEMGTFPYDVRHDYDGHPCSHRKGHNVYGMQMHRATYEGFKRATEEKRPFTLTRSTYAGGQRYGATWTGDNKASWDHLKIANIQMQRLSICGFSFAGSDIGGFVDQPDAELFIRWLQLGLFHGFYRVHSSGDHGDQEPWSFGEESLPVIREVIEMRYKLLPYIYTTTYQYVKEYTPAIKPLFYVDQKDPETYQRMEEFVFGDHILVCPISQEGSDGRWMYVPDGEWYYFWTDERIEGDKEEVWVDAPLNQIPMFVRAGAIIPLSPAMQYVGEKKLDELDLHLYYGSRNSILYEDDGTTLNYAKGDYCIRRFETKISKGILKLTQLTEGDFVPEYSRFRLYLHGFPEGVRTITIDGNQENLIFENRSIFAIVPLTFSEITIN